MTNPIEESPVIRFTDPANRAVVESKLATYRQRLAAWMGRHYQPPWMCASWYAVRVAEALLECGEVVTYDLAREIASEFDGCIPRLDMFENYCGVINAYATGDCSGLYTRHRDGSTTPAVPTE